MPQTFFPNDIFYYLNCSFFFILLLDRSANMYYIIENCLFTRKLLFFLDYSRMAAGGNQSVNPSELLHLSWREPIFCANLNQNNVLDYFSDKSNPFYDRRCNNEVTSNFFLLKYKFLFIASCTSIVNT